jgi:4-amino-4-deoxy-L-arabinose transferase-like glycosyltransferase
VSAITTVLVYYTASRLVNKTAGAVAGFAFAILFDTLRFTVFLLSETVFTFALVLTIWSLFRYRTNRTSRRRMIILGSLAYLSITRPFGPPIVAGWLLLETLPRDSDYRTGFIPRWAAIGSVVTIPLVMLLFSSAPGKLASMERGWREGWIMYLGKSEFILREYLYTPRSSGSLLEFVVFNPDHIAIMGVLRTVVFFVPLIGGEGFSPFWTGLNVAVLGPLVLFGIYGLVKARRCDKDIIALLGVPIVIVVAIVAVTFVSLSWRYRAPLGPILAMSTGYVVATSPRVQRFVQRLGQR